MAYIASGQAAQDEAARGEDRAMDEEDERFSFGKFNGLDNRPHLGIEKARFVTLVPLNEGEGMRR